jgi:hypothetical protein
VGNMSLHSAFLDLSSRRSLTLCLPMALTFFISTGALNISKGFIGGRGPDNNGAVGGAAGAVHPQQGPITANVSAACPAGCGLSIKIKSVQLVTRLRTLRSTCKRISPVGEGAES